MKHYTLYFILLTFTALNLSIVASAQTSVEENAIVRSVMDRMFEDLDRTKISTGLLLDYAVDLLDLPNYNGAALVDSNYVDSRIFEDILRSVRSASLNKSDFRDIKTAMDSFITPMISNSVNVAFALYKYNYIKANALEDGLIIYDSASEKVSDAYQGGVWQNPYGEAFVFAFTPSSNVCAAGNVKYDFSSDFVFANQSFSIIQFDPGDGNGFRNVGNFPVVSVNYSNPGSKELKLRVTLTTGQVLNAHSIVYVMDNDDVPTKAGAANVHSPTDSIVRTTTYNGTTVSAQMTYYSASADGSIRKPFIVVEGFDPWIIQSITGEIDTSLPVNPGYANHMTFAIDYYNCLSLSSDYDLVYIDWNNSTEDIRANAALLMMFLDDINEMKAVSGSTEKNTVMGRSMGGLVVRYALKTMENRNIRHDVATYISHDTPHLGANVPLGALYFINQVQSMLHGNSNLIDLADLFAGNILTDAERKIYSVVHSMAARQMLVNYVNPAGELDNSVHDDWQDILEQLGFPEGDFGCPIQNLTIVNGRSYDIAPSLIYGKHLLYFDGYAKTTVLTDILAPLMSFCSAGLIQMFLSIYDCSFLGEAFARLGSTKFNIHAEVNPVLAISAGQKIADLQFKYTKKFLWLFPKNYTIFASTVYAPSGLYYDGYPGSFYSLNDTPYVETVRKDLGVFASYSYTLGVAAKIMFIPTASSLAITGGITESNFIRDYYSSRPVPEVDTNFDSYYLCNIAEEHITIDSTIFTWIEEHLRRDISGPEYVTDNASFSVPGYTGTLSWSTTDSNIATISNSGNLTAHGNGFVSVIAESYTDGRLFRKEKDIMVNFPDIVIKYAYVTGDGYMFKAVSTSDDATALLHQLVSAGNFRYEWSFIDGEGNMTTQATTSDTFSYLPDTDEEVTVAIRLVNDNGDKGPVKSVSLDLRTPMAVNYKYVIVDSNQNVYFIKSNNTYERGLPSADFAVAFRNVAMNITDNGFFAIYKYMKGNDCYISYPNGFNMTEYMAGTYVQLTQMWRFDFFNSNLFLSRLQDALYRANGAEKVISDFNLTICNTNKEALQAVPFVIIYKPVFPEI